MTGEPLRLRQTLPHGSDLAERISLLRQEIAAQPPCRPARRGRVPLGETRLDRLLAGGLAGGALHEITAAAPGDAQAAAGFALALAARLRIPPQCAAHLDRRGFRRPRTGRALWPWPRAAWHRSGRLVLVHPANAKDALWAMEEALKCRTAAAVIGEIFSAKLYDLTASRRLVLAAQKHGTRPASSGSPGRCAPRRFRAAPRRASRSAPG